MKFFNRFRESLIPGKGFRKYVLYAIGEIVLVVIGILIALAVNNKNQDSKDKRYNKEIAEKVLQQLKVDTTEIDKTLKLWDQIELVADTILQQYSTEEQLRKCVSCKFVLTGIYTPSLDNTVTENIDKVGSKNHLYSRIFDRIDTHYKEKMLQVNTYNEIVNESVTENLIYLRENQKWFAAYSIGMCDADCQEYFATNPFYKNRVAFMQLLINDAYYAELFEFKNFITKDIEELSILLTE